MLLNAIYQRQLCEIGLSFDEAEQLVLADFARVLRLVESLPHKQQTLAGPEASGLGTVVDA